MMVPLGQRVESESPEKGEADEAAQVVPARIPDAPQRQGRESTDEGDENPLAHLGILSAESTPALGSIVLRNLVEEA